MKRLIPSNFLAAAALALGAFGAASAAHAGNNLYFSVGVQGAPSYYPQPAPVYVQPAPVYVQPRPVYVQPQPVYAPRPVYVQPQVYSAPAEVYLRHGPPSYQYQYDDERAHRRAEWRRWYWKHHHHDHDRDDDRDDDGDQRRGHKRD